VTTAPGPGDAFDAEGLELPESFPNPFDELGPHPLARRAAEDLQGRLRRDGIAAGIDAAALEEPGAGKMFGVLVGRAPDGSLGYLKAFSGILAGRFDVAGYAPPLFDREARRSVEVAGERTVSALTARAAEFALSVEVPAARRAVEDLLSEQRAELELVREVLGSRRRARREQRLGLVTASMSREERDAALERLAAESRRDKAERRRLEAEQAGDRAEVQRRLALVERRLAAHSRLHRMVSRTLMKRIHDTYRLVSVRGEERGLRDLFSPGEPPGGAADCAAPKLVAWARTLGWTPLAMAEFWWGAPPPGGGRTAGAFYPACREKCGPVLPFLLDGLRVANLRRFEAPPSAHLELRTIFEDRWIAVVDKPAGLLSVPGKGEAGGDSVASRWNVVHAGAMPVHRLDLDTSGLLVVAKDAASHAALQKQFLARSVEKTYVALHEGEIRGEGGTISLALRADVHDRPRQIHDPVHGLSAVSAWRVLVRGTDGFTRVEWKPRTGRTHQLRVHAAHPLGLGAPIVGDRLYGRSAERLMLHAEELGFVHPVTGEAMRLRSPAPF
jgi:tRNA pseudouridine32 synthase/23S rRNA pseudouridine746 synthase